MLANWWEDSYLLYWLPALFANYYLITPLIVMFSQKLAAVPICREIPMHSLDPELTQFIMDKTNALYAIDFDEPALIHMPSPSPGVKAYLVMLVNRPQGDKVMVTALVGDAEPEIRTCYVEFSTRYASDDCVDTLNSAELSAFSQGPQNIRTQVPSITEVAELYRLHQFKMKTSGISSRKVLYEPDKAIEYLHEYAFKRCYQEQVDKGWLRYDAAGDCYQTPLLG